MWNSIATHISHATNSAFQIIDRRSVSGGSINQAYAISGSTLSGKPQTYFVKLNQASQISMFEVEFLALQQMTASQTMRVPQPICYGVVETSAYIVLEWLDLGYGNAQSWEKMGSHLAALHRVMSENGFGWQRDNTIGSTPQRNSWTADWVEFFSVHRLGYQFQLANRRGGRFPHQAALLSSIPEILAGHEPLPSLVHGDLWSGNAGVTQQGEPVIFDPAAYFGDREVDLAMTELFGSFPDGFYRAYQQAFPLAAGYKRRKILYNLYHILNHFNLFGGSYESQANRMIVDLL